MAKKKNNSTNLMSFDFLPNTNMGSGSGLYSQLAKLGMAQRADVLTGSAKVQAFMTPITKLMEDTGEKVVAGMIEYNEANPDMEPGQIWEGTSQALNDELQKNNQEFKKLNRKLAFMKPTSQAYVDAVKRINEINKSNVDLRDKNKKLLGIQENILNADLSNFGENNSAAQTKFYTDIQQGNGENFSIKEINGVKEWVWTNPNPNAREDQKQILLSKVSADGPRYKNEDDAFLVNDELQKAQQTVSANLTDGAVARQVRTIRKSLGNEGTANVLFASFNTSDPKAKLGPNDLVPNGQRWLEEFVAEAFPEGTNPNSAQVGEYLDSLKGRKSGLNTNNNPNGINVADHYYKWLAKEFKAAPKFGKGVTAPSPNPPDVNSNLPSAQKFNANENSFFRDPDSGEIVKGTISGQQARNVALELESGEYNGWNLQQDGSWRKGEQTMSGNEKLEKISRDMNFNFLEDARFRIFRGTAGQSQVVESRFPKLEGDEDKALEQLQEAYIDIADMFSIPLVPGKDIIEFNNVSYSLEDSKEIAELKKDVEKYTNDPLNPNK